MGALPVWMQWDGLKSVSNFWRRESLPKGKIDMGNGRVLGPEDVLEGHYRRLTTRRQSATRRVNVQVGDNLMAAITVLAPDLAPLTEVAEQVSGALPVVEPEPRFRENLHQALERTHRQYAAQRALGTRPVPRPKPATPIGWWVVLVGVVAAVMLLWGWRSRNSTVPAT